MKQIQTVLSSEPVLVLPDFSLPFAVMTDASNVGIGGVLLQLVADLWMPICYVSRKLLERETRYSTIEREALGIVYTIEKLAKYLWGKQFVLFVDHKPLTYLSTSKYANSRLMRWALSLQEFQYTVQPIEGVNNTLADLLSRSQFDQNLSVQRVCNIATTH